MNEKLNRLLDEVQDRLLSLFGDKLSSIILYGSYARGNSDEESDVDIIALVEMKDLKKYNDKIIDFEIDLTIKHGLMPSILVENKSDFSREREREFFFQNVIKDGKIIYAA